MQKTKAKLLSLIIVSAILSLFNLAIYAGGNGQQIACSNVVKSHFDQRVFPTIGPPGCRYVMTLRDCLDTPLKTVNTKTLEASSYSRIMTAEIDPSDPKCAVVKYSIGVARPGHQGRICFHQNGFIRYEVTLIPKCSD
jgi:hypothetical protein